METTQQVLAAYFEECARMLRKHPELFDAAALGHVGVVAGLSTRVVRSAARGERLAKIVRTSAGELLRAIAADAGLTGGVMRGTDRQVLALLAGARRGYVRAAELLMEREALALVRLGEIPGAVVEYEEGPATIESPCPRCGARATRDLRSPAPCAECGFVFEGVG